MLKEAVVGHIIEGGGFFAIELQHKAVFDELIGAVEIADGKMGRSTVKNTASEGYIFIFIVNKIEQGRQYVGLLGDGFVDALHLGVVVHIIYNRYGVGAHIILIIGVVSQRRMVGSDDKHGGIEPWELLAGVEKVLQGVVGVADALVNF